MIRRLFLVVFTLITLGLVWVGAIAGVTLAIFKQRHPNKCMAYYYNKASPEGVSWDCEGSSEKFNYEFGQD